MTEQRMMRRAAEEAAVRRAQATGLRCLVYRRVGFPSPEQVTWYVRTAEEEEPEGAVLEFTADPPQEAPR